MKSIFFSTLFIFCLISSISSKGIQCGSKKAGEYCAATSQCPPGFHCCTYCPMDGECGPNTPYRPYCRWGPCQEDINYVEFVERERIILDDDDFRN